MMYTAQTEEFFVGMYGFNGTKKYVPQAMTYNRKPGYVWTRWVFQDKAWIHTGKVWVREGAAEIEVQATVDQELDEET